MKKIQIVSALVLVFFCLPIWFYLMYKILQAVNASDLMWFLFWVYVPFTMVTMAISRMFDKE